ncbi:hypothetical protein [Streptomyces sp. NPDC088196]
MSPLAVMSTLFVSHVAFAAVDLADVAVVVGDMHPRAARLDGRKD